MTDVGLIARALLAVAVVICLRLFWRRASAGSAPSSVGALPARWWVALWLAFALLVAAGVSGSSLPLAAAGWRSAGEPVRGAVADPLLAGLDPEDRAVVAELALAAFPGIRSDEFLVSTPWALSQLAHEPPFPVVNENIGGGQNMLLAPMNPVLHTSSLVRPGTWGYLLLGADRGLAWSWWFGSFALFHALVLLFGILLRSPRSALTALGAAWLVASAGLVCWSLTPAYFAFFPVLCCVAAYRVVENDRPRALIGWGLLLGWSAAGFVLTIYPPYQVPLGYVLGALLAALLVRDGLAPWRRAGLSHRLIACGVGLSIFGVVVALFLGDAAPALAELAGSDYPGRRTLSGDDYPFALVLRGYANLLTSHHTFGGRGVENASEASSFYHMYPAAIAALALVPALRRRVGVPGLVLAGAILVFLGYGLFGAPEWLCRITLLSYVRSIRSDLAVGLAGIALCLLVLRAQERDVVVPRVAAVGVAIAMAALLVGHGLAMQHASRGFPPAWLIALAATFGGSAAFVLLSGRTRIFFELVLSATVATTFFFNPLTRGAQSLEQLELAAAIRSLDRAAGGDPLWLDYGPYSPGVLVASQGGRTLSGVHFHPNLAQWRKLDPEGRFEQSYNRYAFVELFFTPDVEEIDFDAPRIDHVRVWLNPENPALQALGVRYVLASGRIGARFRRHMAGYELVYRGRDARFHIWRIPERADLGAP